MDLSLDQIYARLVRGMGHELVNDDNVFALIERAERDRRPLLAEALREWQAPCSSVQQVPTTMAPTRGFNRENAKH